MKKLATVFAALFLLAGLASAQTADTTAHHSFGGRKMAMMQRRGFGRGFSAMHRLNLTDDQKAQMKSANEDYHKQLSALQSNNSISLGDYKSQLASLQKSHREKISSILTDEQKKTLADSRKKATGRMRAAGTANLDKMKQNLGLSDDQVAKIKTQREALHTQLQGIRKDSTLLPGQKREKVKEVFTQQKAQLKQVLTPEQFAKLQEMHKQQRFNHMHRVDSTQQQAK